MTGRDIGALSKEYFWKALLALSNEKIDGSALFVGADDHLLPSTNAFIMRSGVLKAVGKLMSHAAIHTGIAFIGLARPIAEFITKVDVNSDTPILMEPADVDSYEIGHSLRLVSSIHTFSTEWWEG